MRNRTRIASAAALVALLSLGTLAVVADPPAPHAKAPQADDLAAGLEREVAGEDGKPVPLDPKAPTKVSAPQQVRGVAGAVSVAISSLPDRKQQQRPERPEPGQPAPGPSAPGSTTAAPTAPAVAAAAPSPLSSFQGLGYNGAGYPPDTVGDVGPNHYVQAVNTKLGIFSKSGSLLKSLTFDSFFPNGTVNGGTGTLCDTNNYGDPVVVYDTFESRWVVSDFAFTMSGGNVTSDNFQCFAVSKNSDAMGDWYFYAFKVASGGDMADYPKLGVWPDGIYMSANVFGPSSFKNVRVWAFNKTDLYRLTNFEASPRAIAFDLPQSSGSTTVFSLLPSNARSQTGSPPASRPNLFASIYGSYQVRVWTFSTDWTTNTGTFSSAPTDVSSGSFSVFSNKVPSPNNSLDSMSYRLMMQNQYSNIGGVESLWLTHTVSQSNVAAPRWYQVPVTEGTVSAPAQSATWQPDTALHRFIPSLAVDKYGDLALGYSISSRSVYPGIRYAGRLANEPANIFGQSEAVLANGGGSQTYSSRWGDYAAMSLDPDGCTFWFTTEIYNAPSSDWSTRIGSFAYPSCTSPPAAAPAQIAASLTASAVSKSQINLSWESSTGASGYIVERSTNQTSWSVASVVPAGTTSYSSTGLARNTVYYYRVRAYNYLGYSNYATGSARTLS